MAEVHKNENVKIDAGYPYLTTECSQTGEWEPELLTCIAYRSKFVWLALRFHLQKYVLGTYLKQILFSLCYSNIGRF